MWDQQERVQNGLELLEGTENVQVRGGSRSTGTAPPLQDACPCPN